jgi:hypothetical protein
LNCMAPEAGDDGCCDTLNLDLLPCFACRWHRRQQCMLRSAL